MTTRTHLQRAFPITRPHVIDANGRKVPRHIDWSALNEDSAWRNHGQSLQQLADRGGLDPTEAAAIIECRRWRPMLMQDALDVIDRYAVEIQDRERTG